MAPVGQDRDLRESAQGGWCGYQISVDMLARVRPSMTLASGPLRSKDHAPKLPEPPDFPALEQLDHVS
jgi:hypothetical protein